MTALLLLHAVLGLGVLALGTRLGRWSVAVAALAPAAAVVWLVTRLSAIVDGKTDTEHTDWIPALGLGLDLRLDGFAFLMLVLVSGIGVLVFAYADRYFRRGSARTARLAGLLTLFSGSMFGLVVADNVLVLYGFWELTSITSYLLIGDEHEQPRARAAALQALLVTGAGALAMLAGFIVLGQAAGTYRLSAILADPPDGTRVTVALLLVLLGAFTKSAQYPFHSWLPSAMVASTPVSAYLHSATMVKAGVYLVARLAPAYADLGWWRPLVVSVGVLSMLGGGVRALRQTDLKLLLAMGTVSQLGLLMAVFGWGTPLAVAAGCVTLLAHGAFKAAGFMAVGIVDHQVGTRDLRRIPRPGPGWGGVVFVTVASAASMAGVPLLFGFIAKESDVGAIVDEGAAGALALAGVVVGSVLTVGYSARLAAGLLGRLAPSERPPPAGGPPSAPFVAPAAVLAAASVVLGVVPRLADGIVAAAARSLDDAAGGVHLALWHGINLELGLSIAVLAGGALLFAGQQPVDVLLAAGDGWPTAAGAYGAVIRALNTLANRVTAVAQPGSLPVYVGVILLTAAVVPAALLLSGAWWPGWPEAVGVAAHVPIAALLLGGALSAAVVRRRFSAALFLGVVGYAMAGLFVVQGAPDLALTQVAIETLSTVLFVLVLRRLPDRFERVGRPHRALRRGVAAAVGTSVFLLTLGFGMQDPPTTVSDEMIQRSLPDGDGRNIVNVTLVDFRGLDTLGEITVLAAAAIGTVALARAGRRARPDGRGPGRPAIGDGPAERVPPPVGMTRLVTLDVSVRIVFAAVMVGSLWLLFAGHNQPGGGFVGGIVAGAAIALRYVAGGIADVRQLSRSRPWIVLGFGLLVSVLVAIAPLFVGGAVLESASASLDVPVLGTIKLTSALVFDIGVYFAVIGLALMVFESFGDDAPAPSRAAASASAVVRT